MPPRGIRTFEILFRGGWATDLGTNFSGVTGEGEIRVPFLIDCENAIYHLNGGIQKMPGTVKLNTTVIPGATAVMGLYEYIRWGTGGTETRKRICHHDTVIYKEDLDGTWDSLFTGLEAGKIPSYDTFDDILIIASDSSTDVPRSWDQTTAQNLAGTPPNFDFSRSHKNRQWAAGVDSNPSRLYYSDLNDPENWTGGTSGSIDIDRDDGDRITGIFPHKNDLWVLKGPYHGSLHRITGSAPTGTDAFARIPYIRGVGGINHNSIFKFGDDVGWMGIEGQIHSLAATSAYGDFNQAFLSAPIFSFIRDELNFSRIQFTWAATHSPRGQVLIDTTRAGATQNNIILAMDYRFAPVRWSFWPLPINAASVAVLRDTSGVRRPFYGHYDGFVRSGDQPTRTWDGTAISYKVTLPFLNFGTSDFFKTLYQGRISIVPKGNYNKTFQWQRDNASAQTATVSQGGADVLGTADANQFTLGVSRLAGGKFASPSFDMSGEFRDVQFQISQVTNNEDSEDHGIGVQIAPGPATTEAP